MSKSEKTNIPAEYRYYDYRNGNIARETVGSDACASDRIEFYIDGEWINDYDMSLHLSDAMRGCCGYSFFDYEELTEDEAMRRIAEIDGEVERKNDRKIDAAAARILDKHRAAFDELAK